MSGPCADRLEVLGAWLDGEASAAEVAELERHVQVCEGCRETSRMLADLGSSVAHQPTLAPPADFAARTARVVVPAAGGFAWQRFASARSASVGMALAELLDRQPRGRPGPAQVMLLFGLPALLLGLWNPSVPAWFLKIAAVCLLVGLPLHHWQARVARLGSLQRGRALEEILQTGVSRGQLLDALAVAGLGRLAWAGLGLVPLLCLADLRAGLLWLPALLAVAWLGSYPAACWSLGGGWRFGMVAGVGALGLVLCAEALGPPGPFMPLALMGFDRDTLAFAGSLALKLGPAFIVTCACLLLCRVLAFRLLERGPAQVRRTRNRWLLGVSESPVAMRENVRRAARAPRGLAGVVLLYLPLPLSSAALAGSLTQDVESGWTWTILVLVTVGIVARAALRTLGAVLQEREQGTWETLLQSGAIGPSFILGWVKVAVSEAGLAFLALWALPLVALVLTPREPLDQFEESLLSAPILTALLALALGLTAVAALLGLALSARSRTLGEARASLLAWTCGQVLALVALTGVAPAVVSLDPDLNPLALPLCTTACVTSLTALWSAFTLRRWLLLPSLAPTPSSLTGRLATCSGCAGAALAVASDCWPVLPSFGWDLLAEIGAGYLAGWLAGRALAWLVAPILHFQGRNALQRWVVTLLWAQLFGLALGGLRLLMVCLEWLPGSWAYDQIALAFTVSAGIAAVLGLRSSSEAQRTSTGLGHALIVSSVRVMSAAALLAAFTAWQYHVAPADAERILAEVRERRLASRNLPPPSSRLARLLRGDWPSGASADYLSPGTLRPRLAEVAELIVRGEFPASDPSLPLAMKPAFLEGLALVLADLGGARSGSSIEGLLLAIEWSARGRRLHFADRALLFTERRLDRRDLTKSDLRTLLVRTEGLDGLDFTRTCDEFFADDLARVQEQRVFYPDRPEFYWRHQRQVLTLVYLRLRPLCTELANSEAIRTLENEAMGDCRACEPAWIVRTDFAALVGQERAARERLRAIRAEAQRQLEAK